MLPWLQQSRHRASCVLPLAQCVSVRKGAWPSCLQEDAPRADATAPSFRARFCFAHRNACTCLARSLCTHFSPCIWETVLETEGKLRYREVLKRWTAASSEERFSFGLDTGAGNKPKSSRVTLVQKSIIISKVSEVGQW